MIGLEAMDFRQYDLAIEHFLGIASIMDPYHLEGYGKTCRDLLSEWPISVKRLNLLIKVFLLDTYHPASQLYRRLSL